MVGGWDRRNSIKLPGHSNVRPTGLHKQGRKGRRGLLHSFSLRAFEWRVDTMSNWVGNVQFDTFWASDLSSCLSSWAGKASSIHSFVFKESVLVEQRSFLWVIGSCSEAVNQTRDWSSWLIDCRLWSKVPLVAGDQISHEKMLYSSWMNKAIQTEGMALSWMIPTLQFFCCCVRTSHCWSPSAERTDPLPKVWQERCQTAAAISCMKHGNQLEQTTFSLDGGKTDHPKPC